MKLFFIFAFILFTTNAPIKPDRNSNHPNNSTDSERMSPLVVVNNRAASTQEEHGDKKAPDRDASVGINWEAVGTWALVIVGIMTLIGIFKQAKETSHATKAMDKNIALQFRPELIVRAIRLIPGEWITVAGESQFRDSTTWQLECLIANIGASLGEIIEGNLTLVPIKSDSKGRLPTFPPYSDARDSFENISLKAGKHRQIQIPISHQGTTAFKYLRELRLGGNTDPGILYCIGFIQYRDSIGTERRTAFGLHYDVQTEGFVRMENSDYEYAD